MAPARSPAAEQVAAWDLPTRLFKWSLVFLVAMAWISDKFGGSIPVWHKANGYAILCLIVFRLLWGFVGGSTARFSSFLPTPRRVFGYAAGLAKGAPPRYLGHNPLGALMILALLAILAAQGVLGLYSGDADRLVIEGPLAATVPDAAVAQATRLHRLGFDLILILVSLHVSANLAYDLFKKEGLIRAMIVGAKPAGAYVDAPRAAPGSMLAAAACLAVAAAIVFGAIAAMCGRFLF